MQWTADAQQTQKSRGPMDHFEHPNALVETTAIGPRTRIWAFAHVLAGARLGADCNICDHVFIENDVIIGDRVTIKCGVQLWDGLRVEDDVFIASNATFTNDLLPVIRDFIPRQFHRQILSNVYHTASCKLLRESRLASLAMQKRSIGQRLRPHQIGVYCALFTASLPGGSHPYRVARALVRFSRRVRSGKYVL